jgi:predicted acyl esterase
MEQLVFWRKLTEHPAYDAFWQQQAMDRVLAAQPLTVPVMLVAGLWDQEDGRQPRRLDDAGRAAHLQVRAPERHPRLPARPPPDGAGAIELVPAVRPEPADVRPQYLLGEAG